MVSLDPNGPPDQQPAILSDGYTNPFAFVTVDGAVWVADNAVGDDVEHIGRADLADRSRHTPTGAAPRAPSAMVSLDDGRLAVCGFLDGQLLPWSPDNRSVDATPVATNPVDTTPATPAPDPVTAADDTTVPPGSTGYGPSLGPCRTGAATLADGSIVTVTDTAIVLLPDRPTP